MKSEPDLFRIQCNMWLLYACTTLTLSLFAAVYLHLIGFTGWTLFVDSFIVFGSVTCVIWWVWVMKKMYDIATWWIDLKNSLDTTTQLLHEAKEHLNEIKQQFR